MTSSASDSFNLAWHCLGRQAAERGAKTALILCDGPTAFRSWTYRKLDLMVRKLAGGLIESGLKKGDRVMIRAENDIDFVLAFFATVAIGCVAQPASPLLTAEEALALAEDPAAAAIFLGNGTQEERKRFSHLSVFDSAEARRLAAECAPADYAPTRPTIRPISSSLRVRPLSQKACCMPIGSPSAGGQCTGTGWGSARTTSFSMPATSTGPIRSGVGVLDPWACGATGSLYAGVRDPTVWLKLIEAKRATIFAAVPGVYRQILKYGDPSAFGLSSLRHGISAGEALSPDLLAAGMTRREPGFTKRWA